MNRLLILPFIILAWFKRLLLSKKYLDSKWIKEFLQDQLSSILLFMTELLAFMWVFLSSLSTGNISQLLIITWPICNQSNKFYTMKYFLWLLQTRRLKERHMISLELLATLVDYGLYSFTLEITSLFPLLRYHSMKKQLNNFSKLKAKKVLQRWDLLTN